MATLLMPLPDSDFDPTESGVPWLTMRDHGHHVVFATPSGRTARADPKMVTGEGLGILSPLLKADANGRSAYLYMEQSDAFQRPISYGEIRAEDFDALLLPGGHAPGMRVYLGSGVLPSAVADFFAQEKPVGAICHGVLLAARSSLHSCKSVLYGRKTTALTKQMELIAWRLIPRGFLAGNRRHQPSLTS
jgi:protease I